MPRLVDPQHARRLIISKQHLDGSPRPAMLNVIRDIGCLQLDPISAVARSHLLVLFSRIGVYDVADFEHLLYGERALFEYWAHEASIVLAEDYPVHAYRMKHYPNSSAIRKWLTENEAVLEPLQKHILERIRTEGPLPSREFSNDSYTGGLSSGWTGKRDVNKLIDYLWHKGILLVSRRQGIQRVWDIAERCLPEWTPRQDLEPRTLTQRSTQRALKALGIASQKQIKRHYTRRRYPQLASVWKELQSSGKIIPVEVSGWRGEWFIHVDDMPLLERIEAGDWQPKTVLLSPFDNLICDRDRCEEIFDFRFRLEIYTPKEKREYGYYVLPLLHGDRFIGRMDAECKNDVLYIHIAHAENSTPPDTVGAVREAVQDLAWFLGAVDIQYGDVPEIWRSLR